MKHYFTVEQRTSKASSAGARQPTLAEASRRILNRGLSDREDVPGKLTPLSAGWAFESSSGGRYFLWLAETEGYVADVAATIGGQRHFRRVDLSTAACQTSLARAVAKGDEALECEVRRDLLLTFQGIRLARISAEADAAIDALFDADDDPKSDLLIRGLCWKDRWAVAVEAARRGASCIAEEAAP